MDRHKDKGTQVRTVTKTERDGRTDGHRQIYEWTDRLTDVKTESQVDRWTK